MHKISDLEPKVKCGKMNTLPKTTQLNSVGPSVNDIEATNKLLSKWIFERIQPFVTGRALEINSSNADYSGICLQNNISIETISIDLTDPFFEENYAGLINTYDTVLALHLAGLIVSNRLISTNCKKLLKSGGHLITRLPAHTALYMGLEQGFEDWKIHNLKFINLLLRKDFKILKTGYFTITNNQPLLFQEATYSEEVGLFRLTNANDLNQTGLAVIVVGRKR